VRARDLFRYSSGALRGHRLRTGFSLAGVAIGVTAVILLTSLGEGARQYVLGEFGSLGSNLIIVIPGKTETTGAAPFISEAPHDLTLEDARALERLPRVVRTSPIALGSAPVSFGARRREVPVFGTDANMAPIRHLEVASGEFLGEGDAPRPVIVLGSKLKEELFGAESPLGRVVRVGENRLRVIGVLKPLGTSIGMNIDDAAYVPAQVGLRVFNRTSLFRIMVEVRSYREIQRGREDVLTTLRERHGEEDVTIISQDSVMSTLGRILGMLTAAMGGIAGISLSVAGIGIMNVMLVTVVERTREIGLLKALGATRPQIIAAFLVEAAVISFSGGVIGLAFSALAVTVARHLMPDFPLQPPVWAVIAAVAVSAAVGVIFGLLPARRAARLDPIAALARR